MTYSASLDESGRGYRCTLFLNGCVALSRGGYTAELAVASVLIAIREIGPSDAATRALGILCQKAGLDAARVASLSARNVGSVCIV